MGLGPQLSRTKKHGPWALGPKGRSLGPVFFLITFLFGANCSVLGFCCIIGCGTSGWIGAVIPRLHDHSNQGEAVIPRLRFSRPESLNLWSSGPEAPTFLGPRAWAQGEGPRAQGLFFNHSSSWGELFCVGFLLHCRVQNFEVRRTYFCRPENLQLWSCGPKAPMVPGPRA